MEASGVIWEGSDSFPIVEEIEAKKRGIRCAVYSKLLKLTRMLMKKYREGQRELQWVFVDLRKSLRQGFILFYLYIYPPNSQESDGGANT